METFYTREEYIAAAQARGLHVVSNAAGEEYAYNQNGSFGVGQVDEGGEGYVGMLFSTMEAFKREYKAGLPLGCPTGDVHVCHWNRYEVITSEVHLLPIVIVSATTLDDMLDSLGLWSSNGELTAHETTIIMDQLEKAKAPNDSLLGTSVTESFYLTGLGMHIHIQLA